MTTTATAAHGEERLRWEPPAKGDWRGLHDHFPRALTAEYERLLADGMAVGEAVWIERYGLPVRTIDAAFVHGRVFISAAPLLGRRSDALPPPALLRAALRVVPAFRRRAAAAARAVEERPWLEEAAHWFDVERPAWIAGNEALQAVDPGTLEGAGLLDHLRAARANAQAGYRTHFRLHGCDLIPTGMLLVRSVDWGLDPAAVAGLLAGSSPASRGEAALPDWCLVTGYDLDERAAAELPARPASPPRRPTPAGDRVEEAARDAVPADQRDEWDRLLADARATYGVRDSNGILAAAWPVGLLRRAMLEAGRRLVAAGTLRRAEDAVELTVDELVRVLGTGDDQIGQVAAARLDARRRLSAHPAPPSLGPPQDLPLAVLPPPMRTVARALLGLRDLGISPTSRRAPLSGIGIGTGTCTGRALVATDPAEALVRFEPGDVVVTVGTCPAWNTILAHAGAVVTEEGGPLSHAAVIARELGLPALIGCAEAATRIPDGATVELDLDRGVVRVV